MNELKGTTVILYEKEKIGVDDFGEDIFREIPVEVENVLISPESSTDIVDDLNIFGKKAVYTLGIPKKIHIIGAIQQSNSLARNGIHLHFHWKESKN